MTLLVFGKTGQVATELARLAPDATFLSRDQVDLADPMQVAAILSQTQADAIINAAAYTAVDKAESEADVAQAVNGTSVGIMAAHAAAQGIPFVHISTDYVFDGTGASPRAPHEATGPLGVYGESKLAGEALITGAGGIFAILRTSWVFSAHGNNFVKTMLRLSESRDQLSIVADQIGGPTPAGAIAQACLALVEALKAESGKSGTYHFSGTPDASWADFARCIFAAAGRDIGVEDIPTTAFPTPAARPLNSRLDCATLQTEFGISRPDWKTAVAQIVGELT
ncbi:MAG: dTDP-4-dehydrorhamnose reductase [Paracoccaceae bacterium]